MWGDRVQPVVRQVISILRPYGEWVALILLLVTVSGILESVGMSSFVPLLLTLADGNVKVKTEEPGIFAYYVRFLDGYPLHGARLESRVVKVGEAVSIVVVLFSQGVTVVALYTLILLMSCRATVVATATLAALTVGLQGLSRISECVGYRQHEIVREFRIFGTEVILGIRQIKVFSAERRLIERWAQFIDQLSRLSLRLRAFAFLPHPLGETRVPM